MNWKHEQVIARFKTQGIDLDEYHVLIDGNVFNGEEICGSTFSHDKKWVCLPVYDEESSIITGGYEYKPQCFEIYAHYETWLQRGDMLYKSEVWLLKGGD